MAAAVRLHREPDRLARMSSSRPRPLGEIVNFTAPAHPERISHYGRRVIVRPLDPSVDADALYPLAHAPDGDPSIWDYLPERPFPDVDSYRRHMQAQAASSDPLFFTITAAPAVSATANVASATGAIPVGVPAGTPLGVISYLSIVPEHGRIEIGHIWFSPQLQRTPAATEAIFLLARHAFDDLGYRRLEWKCNARNAPSRSAALRYGFLYEGTFIQHQIVKGRNRDTAWFAITDGRWPKIREAFEAWLDPGNFDARGAQKTSLRELSCRPAAPAAARPARGCAAPPA